MGITHTKHLCDIKGHGVSINILLRSYPLGGFSSFAPTLLASFYENTVFYTLSIPAFESVLPNGVGTALVQRSGRAQVYMKLFEDAYSPSVAILKF